MWWVISMILVAVLVLLWLWLKQQKLKTTWYDLALSILGVLLLVYAVHNILDFRVEHEMVAAWNSLLIFGLPAIILLLIAAFSVWLRQFKARKKSPALEVAEA